ncbi:MAG: 30S ribosomal protein S1, partial [Terracidiphilus sp.]
ISEAGDPVDGHSALEQGLENDFKIIKINVEEKKVGLSLRTGSSQEADRPARESSGSRPDSRPDSRHEQPHKHPVSSSTTTLGDLVNWRKGER